MELEIKSFKVGERVTGAVIDVDKDVIYMDIGASCDAKIDKQHYSHTTVNDFRAHVKVGDEIKTMITYVSDEQILLSRLPFENEALFEEIKQRKVDKTIFTINFDRFNRGGLEKRDVFTYFMPSSQIGVKGAEPKDYVGKDFEVMISDIDEKRKQIIVSARIVQDEKYREKKAAAISTLEVGKKISVVITNVVEAGLEVRYQDIIRGFVPRRELSHLPIDSVVSTYELNQVLEIEVREIRKDGQFTGSIKTLLPTPWETFVENYKENDIVNGQIKRIIEIGAFVELVPGMEGLLHRSEISYDEFVNFKDVVSVDETIEVKIIKIDAKAKRVSLSIKQLEADPWATLWQTYHEGDVVNVTIRRIERNHMWVNLVQYVDAMLYRRETLIEDNRELSDIYKEGETLEVKITEINPKRRRIAVSLAAIVRDAEQKQLDEYREKVAAEVSEELLTLKGKFQAALGNTE